MKPVYARLTILLAKDARLGLVIRHGTAKSVCTLLWDRKTDQFELGQWMRGRIHIPTCDLAPDGRHFIYTADKYDNAENPTWTVVSRTPYLKAVAYYPGCHLGGWFLNSSEYCVPRCGPTTEDRESPEVRRVLSDTPAPFLHAARLVAGGWVMEDFRARFNGRLEFFRPAGNGWILRSYLRGGCKLSSGELAVNTEGWEWADIDAKRVIWTTKGCLWAGKLRKDGLHETHLLYDFNGMKFQAIAAPYEGGRPVRPTPPPTPIPTSLPARKPPRAPRPKKPNRSKVRPDDEVNS